MKIGLLSSTIVDISKTNFILIKSWISKKHFDNGRKNWQKFSNEAKEMGAIVSGIGGEAKNISLDLLKDYLMGHPGNAIPIFLKIDHCLYKKRYKYFVVYL